MALWPFRRKSSRKRPRSGAALSDAEGPPARSQTEGVVVRAASKKKQRTEPSKLQRRPRAYSFSPGRQDEIGDEKRRRSPNRSGQSTRRRDYEAPPQEAISSWDRTPTLHHKKSGRPNRRKSSKRKMQDRDRAAEIKAMSSFQPIRPAADAWTSGRPMKKDSKRATTAPGFRGHPTSDVSLPIPESIHSSLSSDSEYGSFKVSALDSLAPRPTLRYSQGGRWTSSRTTAASQNVPRGRPLAEKEPIAEETFKEHKRIDDLADGLDARDLRELMEREDRRRKNKSQRDKDRAKRRLAREVEKQKAEADEARKSGTPPPENLERGVLGREIGLGIDPASVTVTTTTEEEEAASGVSEPMPDADPVVDVAKETPAEGPQSTSNLALHTDYEHTIPEEPAQLPSPTEQTKPQDSTSSLPHSSRLAGILRSKKSRSKSTLASEREKMASPPVIDEDTKMRQGSVDSQKRGRFSLSSFLRWGGKSRRSSGGPPSFSNTSREEMHAAAAAAGASATALTPAQAQAQTLAKLQGEDITPEPGSGVYISRKPSSKRTKSRFREDLPEYLMSPPDSRVQSPEAEALPSVNEQATPGESATQPIAIPISKNNPTHHQAAMSPSPEPHQSMSLASIDSEGSWLSGKVGARRSAIRDSIARANRLEQDKSTDSPTNSTQEDLAILDDDYYARLAPNRNSGILTSNRLSEDGRPSSDEEEGGHDSQARWGAVGARPNVVHVHKHDRSTMQSHEGLLNIESGDEDEGSNASPTTPSVHEQADLRRARSVNVGKGGHVRNFSAGSAKLLDITPRSSIDGRTRSGDRRSSAPLQ